MSIEVMSLVWKSTVPAPERFTLLALADRADDAGRCWPSVSALARKCLTGERTIRRHLEALKVMGVLEVNYRAGTSSHYSIRVDALAKLAQEDPGQSDTPVKLAAPVKMADPPGQSDRPTPANLAGHPGQIDPQYIIDPSLDTSSDPSPSPKRRRRTAYTEAFEAFWVAYGQKGTKRPAFNQWQLAIKRVSAELIMAAVPPYVASRPDAQYRKDAERWLKDDGWESVTVTTPDPTDWLRAEWQAGRTRPIQERTGLVYRPPELPLELARGDTEAFLVARAREWITANREEILDRLNHRRAS
jgi:DNA-binding transcriptional ArsR family regulator